MPGVHLAVGSILGRIFFLANNLLAPFLEFFDLL